LLFVLDCGTSCFPDSIREQLYWLFKTYWRRKREYPALFAQPEYQHLQVFRFSTPRQTQEWQERYAPGM
jgi:hypothetical protein